MRAAAWIVRHDGMPTTGVRLAAVVVLVAAFAAGFAAQSRGEETEPRLAAALVTEHVLDGVPTEARADGTRIRLAAVARLPAMLGDRRERSQPDRPAVLVPQPLATPAPEVASPTPAPEPAPVVSPVAPAPAPPAQPSPAQTPAATPAPSFDTSG